MRRHLITTILYTIVTTFIFGIAYPYLVTGVAQLIFKDKANGQLMEKNGQVIGLRIIGQPFSAPKYFYSRPSAAGNGYDAANSGGSNFAPANKKLIDRIAADATTARTDQPGVDIPVDLVTASASGLDPDITPDAAEFQITRVAGERNLPESVVRQLVAQHTLGDSLGF